MLDLLGATPPPPLVEFDRRYGAQGHAVIHLLVAGEVAAAVALADRVREERRAAVNQLRAMGVEVAMITGDSEEVARSVAEELGIGRYFAQVRPEHKDQKAADQQSQGLRVAMVGDGVNDAPALIRADIGIAIGSGTDVAVESAGIILVPSNPLDVVRVIRLSRASYRKMIQNLWWAAGYNITALPLAAGAFVTFGIPAISPVVGALLVSLSTVIVAFNAPPLRRADLVTT